MSVRFGGACLVGGGGTFQCQRGMFSGGSGTFYGGFDFGPHLVGDWQGGGGGGMHVGI